MRLFREATDDDETGLGMVVVPVSDADLASLGYVKLDGIDVVRLRESLWQWDQREIPGRQRTTVYALEVARQVLAAVDGAGTAIPDDLPCSNPCCDPTRGLIPDV